LGQSGAVVVAAAWPIRSAEKLDAAYLARSSKIRKGARSTDKGDARRRKECAQRGKRLSAAQIKGVLLVTKRFFSIGKNRQQQGAAPR